MTVGLSSTSRILKRLHISPDSLQENAGVILWRKDPLLGKYRD
jgi:hypothetical protein